MQWRRKYYCGKNFKNCVAKSYWKAVLGLDYSSKLSLCMIYFSQNRTLVAVSFSKSYHIRWVTAVELLTCRQRVQCWRCGEWWLFLESMCTCTCFCSCACAVVVFHPSLSCCAVCLDTWNMQLLSRLLLLRPTWGLVTPSNSDECSGRLRSGCTAF